MNEETPSDLSTWYCAFILSSLLLTEDSRKQQPRVRGYSAFAFVVRTYRAGLRLAAELTLRNLATAAPPSDQT